MAEVVPKERKILVAVDEGEESMHALSWCLKNVTSCNSRDTLVLFYVKPAIGGYTAIDSTGYLFSSDVVATMEKYNTYAADGIIEKAKKMCCDKANDVTVETKVERGDPRDVICLMAEKLCADMLVMGSHGYGMVKRALIGSVSNHCVQNVKCPVMIVKKPKSTSGSK